MQMWSIVELLYKMSLDPFEEETYKELWRELMFACGFKTSVVFEMPTLLWSFVVCMQFMPRKENKRFILEGPSSMWSQLGPHIVKKIWQLEINIGAVKYMAHTK